MFVLRNMNCSKEDVSADATVNPCFLCISVVAHPTAQ